MSQTHLALLRRRADETPEVFGRRVLDMAAGLAGRPDASTVVAYVDDGRVGAPPGLTSEPSPYDGALLVSGVARADLPDADALYGVRRRVVKARTRGTQGARSAGFTRVFVVHRAEHIDHEEFDAHWRDVHSRVHVESSPGTRHYEQLVIDEHLTPDAPRWDGFSLISFGSYEDFTERRYGPGGREAIGEDSAKFVRFPTETFAASEFVYLDEAPEPVYRDDGS